MKYIFGQNVRDIRQFQKLTQGQLADITGLDPTAISHIETGRREPLLSTAIKVSKGLDCNLDDLIRR